MNEEIRTQRMVTFYLCMIVAVMLLMLPLFFTSINALPGNGGGNDPWITSSPVTYHISDANPTGSSVSNDGLVLSMDMETLRSGKIKDFSGGLHDGVITGAIFNDEGIKGSSYSFDGNDVVTVSPSSELNLYGDMTVSMWLKPGSINGNYAVIVGKMDAPGSGNQFEIRTGVGKDVQFFQANSSASDLIPSYGVLSENEWQYFVVTRNMTSKTVDFYINLVCYPGVGNLNVVPNGEGSLCIGARQDNFQSWKGSLDEITLYSRCWEYSEVCKNYNDTMIKYGVQTGSHYSYQAVQNQTAIYPAWSVDSNAPNVTIDSVGKVMGYWESWQNGTYWINITIANINGYAWQNYTVVVVEGAIIPATFQFTNDIIFGLLFYIICLAISLIGFRYGITILCIIALLVSLLPIVSMLNLFGSYAYILILFILPLALIPIATWRK